LKNERICVGFRNLTLSDYIQLSYVINSLTYWIEGQALSSRLTMSIENKAEYNVDFNGSKFMENSYDTGESVIFDTEKGTFSNKLGKTKPENIRAKSLMMSLSSDISKSLKKMEKNNNIYRELNLIKNNSKKIFSKYLNNKEINLEDFFELGITPGELFQLSETVSGDLKASSPEIQALEASKDNSPSNKTEYIRTVMSKFGFTVQRFVRFLLTEEAKDILDLNDVDFIFSKDIITDFTIMIVSGKKEEKELELISTQKQMIMRIGRSMDFSVSNIQYDSQKAIERGLQLKKMEEDENSDQDIFNKIENIGVLGNIAISMETMYESKKYNYSKTQFPENLKKLITFLIETQEDCIFGKNVNNLVEDYKLGLVEERRIIRKIKLESSEKSYTKDQVFFIGIMLKNYFKLKFGESLIVDKMMKENTFDFDIIDNKKNKDNMKLINTGYKTSSLTSSLNGPLHFSCIIDTGMKDFNILLDRLDKRISDLEKTTIEFLGRNVGLNIMGIKNNIKLVKRIFDISKPDERDDKYRDLELKKLIEKLSWDNYKNVF
jgi:hypothetical protein